MVHGLYQYRSFIWKHALFDLRHRYAGTGMGVVWNVLHPLGLIVVYATVFTAFVAGRQPDLPSKFGYTLFLCAGLLPWMAFAECMTRGATAFSANATYLKKLPVPEQVFIAQTAASATLSLVVSFTLLIVVSLLLGLRPAWTWLLLPFPLILLQSIGFGFGLIFGTINVFFSDVAQLLGIALQLLFWLTPIIYRREMLTNHPILQKLLMLHPATPAVEAVRAVFLWGRFPAPWTWFAMLAWAAVTMSIGYLLLRALRAEIRDVI